MTTDMMTLKNARAEMPAATMFRRLVEDIQDKVHAYDAIPSDAIEYHAREKDGWKRSIGATIALLHYANMMLEQAEEKIRHQDQRIKSLEDLSTTDELTGLKNRRGFYESFMAELERSKRDISMGGLLIMIDLDNFKAINDTYGHMAGDACLRLVARTLEAEVRTMDTVARLGGDEFVLLLCNTTRKLAAGRAQDLAWRLNNLSLAWYGDVIPVRASIGLQNYAKGDGPETIFGAADSALYAEKARRKKDKTLEEVK